MLLPILVILKKGIYYYGFHHGFYDNILVNGNNKKVDNNDNNDNND